jgi:putative transposon-encoded protein
MTLRPQGSLLSGSSILPGSDRRRVKATKVRPQEKDSHRNGEDKPIPQERVKFEVYGEEMIEKVVKLSGNSGRVYLPPNWVGHNVKIIRID